MDLDLPQEPQHVGTFALSLKDSQHFTVSARTRETVNEDAQPVAAGEWKVYHGTFSTRDDAGTWVEYREYPPEGGEASLFLFPNDEMEYRDWKVAAMPPARGRSKKVPMPKVAPAVAQVPAPKPAAKPAPKQVQPKPAAKPAAKRAPAPPQAYPDTESEEEEEEGEETEPEEEGEEQHMVGFMLPHHVQDPNVWTQFPLEELRTAMRTRYLGGPTDSYTEVVAQDLIHCCLLLRAGASAERIALRMVEHLESIVAYRHCQSVDGVAQFRRALAAQDMAPPFKKAWVQLERAKPKTHTRPTQKASNSRGDLFLGRTGWEKLSDAERKQLASIRKKVKGQ